MVRVSCVPSSLPKFFVAGCSSRRILLLQPTSLSPPTHLSPLLCFISCFLSVNKYIIVPIHPSILTPVLGTFLLLRHYNLGRLRCHCKFSSFQRGHYTSRAVTIITSETALNRTSFYNSIRNTKKELRNMARVKRRSSLGEDIRVGDTSAPAVSTMPTTKDQVRINIQPLKSRTPTATLIVFT
jgi:hypothetical protein